MIETVRLTLICSCLVFMQAFGSFLCSQKDSNYMRKTNKQSRKCYLLPSRNLQPIQGDNIYTHAHLLLHTNIQIYIHVYTYIFVIIYKYTQLYIHSYVCVCIPLSASHLSKHFIYRAQSKSFHFNKIVLDCIGQFFNPHFTDLRLSHVDQH